MLIKYQIHYLILTAEMVFHSLSRHANKQTSKGSIIISTPYQKDYVES